MEYGREIEKFIKHLWNYKFEIELFCIVLLILLATGVYDSLSYTQLYYLFLAFFILLSVILFIYLKFRD